MSKQFNYIDIHGHVNFPEFDVDQPGLSAGREAVIERAYKAGVAMITVGTDAGTSKSAVELAENYENMWAIVGIHPVEEGDIEINKDEKINANFEAVEELARHPKVVAIGECGLDYFHTRSELGSSELATEILRQKEMFRKHIMLAQKVNKPLMLHVRNGKLSGDKSPIGNAYEDALNILKDFPEIKANFHFFAGSQDDLKYIISRGYSVSFTGVISFTSDYDELIRSVPISQLMSETDCPFVAPKPYRGKRNEPAYVVETVKAIARIRGAKSEAEEDFISKQLVENAKKFFSI